MLTPGAGVGAVRVARELGPGHRIVTILCDSGTKHLSRFWAEVGNIGGGTMSDFEEAAPQME